MKETNENFEGYYWLSNSPRPIYGSDIEESVIHELISKVSNPFVIEAQFYGKKQKRSYSIKFVDNKYEVDKTENLSYSESDVITFYANRMGNKKLRFIRRWEEKPDDNCLGMPVMEPHGFIFVGFKEEEKQS